MCLERIVAHPFKQTAATVTKTFVEVSVKVVAHITIIIDKLACCLVYNKFLVKSVSVSSLVVGICKIAYCNAL